MMIPPLALPAGIIFLVLVFGVLLIRALVHAVVITRFQPIAELIEQIANPSMAPPSQYPCPRKGCPKTLSIRLDAAR